MVKTFQENYRGRMAKCLVVNITNFTYILWKMFKVFLNESTKSKINLFKESYPEEIKQLIHPSQYLKKYGGTMEEPSRSWPPSITSLEFTYNKSQIMSEEQYLKRLEENPYMVPRPDLVSKFKSSRAPDMMPEKELYFIDRTEKRNCYDEIINVKYKKDIENIIKKPISLKEPNNELISHPIYEEPSKQKDALSDSDACNVTGDIGHNSLESRFMTTKNILTVRINKRSMNKSANQLISSDAKQEETKEIQEIAPISKHLIRRSRNKG